MATLDTVCGYTGVLNLETIYLVGSGLSAGTVYELATGTGVPTTDVLTGSLGTASSGGFVAFPLARSNAQSTYYLHDNSGLTSSTHRITGAGPIVLSWGPGSAAPVYYTTPPVITSAMQTT